VALRVLQDLQVSSEPKVLKVQRQVLKVSQDSKELKVHREEAQELKDILVL
jgi:hypothetical protein